MIVKFSANIFKQIIGITFWNLKTILFFVACGTAAYVLCCELGYEYLILPAIPVSILGGALAIFLGFKNSSAYDRWWEARKIWGSIVNDSRSIGMELITYPISDNQADKEEINTWKKRTVYRQIGWIYALRSLLRKESHCEELRKWGTEADLKKLAKSTNLPAQILVLQGKDVAYAFEKGWIEEFRFHALMTTIKKMYDNQGKCERIKNTIFPFYYNYFTNMFLWLFTLSLPFALVGIMHNWIIIPMSVAISFSFAMLNKSGQITETPFEGRAADTPITTICRGIEIDLLEMLEEESIPKPIENSEGKFGVVFKA